MNIYEKLQKARVELQSKAMKKSGENKFAKYDYFELGDFLPQINKIFLELKLFSMVSFDSELATLTVIDAEKPEDKIVFTSPMAGAELKGCHPIQNMGAVETYQRRYLYMAALEIVEHDALDSTTNPADEKKEPKKEPPKQETSTKKEPPKDKPTTTTPPQEDGPKNKIYNMLNEMCAGDVEAMKTKLKEYTAFKGKDGKIIPGKDSIKALSDKQAPVTARIIQKDYDEWVDKEKPF